MAFPNKGNQQPRASSPPPGGRPAADPCPAGLDWSVWRAMCFMEAIRPVWMGAACLSRAGAAYLAVPFASPAEAERRRRGAAVGNGDLEDELIPRGLHQWTSTWGLT